MGDHLDRMDSLFGYDYDRYEMTEDECKKYYIYDVDHYYEMRLNHGIEVTDRGRTMVYEDKTNHKKYYMLAEGLEQFGVFRFDYFMVVLDPDKGHFKRMVIDRMKREKKAVYNEYRAEIKQIDKRIAEVEALDIE